MIYDTETYSSEPISAGLDRYFSAPDFKLRCIAYGEKADHITVFSSLKDICSSIAYLHSFQGNLWAHNARFDQKATQLKTKCTHAQAAANGAPGHLDQLTRFLGTPHKKNPEGKQLIKQCCLPGNEPTQDELDRLAHYCADDVRATISAVSRLRPLTWQEQEQYEVSEIINNRGMRLDRELAEAAVSLRQIEEAELNRQVETLTGLKPKSVKMIDYLRAKLPLRYEQLLWDSEKNRWSLDSSVREALLEVRDDLPLEVAELIETIESARSTSGSKYGTALKYIDYPGSGNILRGAYTFSGARVTGRFSSHGVQMHNLPRPDEGFDPEAARKAVVEGTVPQGELLRLLRSLLRSLIIPREGRVLIWGDSAQIEARVIQWLASPYQDTPLLGAFRRGDDPYVLCGNSIGAPRKVGKVAILACGFQGGVNAMARMCKAYGITLTESQMTTVVTKWRETNPQVVRFWRDLEAAAMQAVLRPGSVHQVGLVAFYAAQDRLLLRLPSGRMLTYWRPTIVETQYGSAVEVDNVSLQPKAGQNYWPRKQMYGGLWAENVTQATAADVLRGALVRCENEGLFVVGHTHDEIIAETGNIERTKEKLTKCLTAGFEWSQGLPLGCDIQTGERYRK